MWFEFPPGTSGVSVQLQEFGIEFSDKEGKAYFQAPDHFAPTILDLPGFKVVARPEGAPEDAKFQGKEPSLVEGLGTQISALKDELQGLRDTHAETLEQLDQLGTENKELKLQLAEAQDQISALEAKKKEK